ncbi:MAG: hypothetical protein IT306_07715 [Chloroflexi bacterium]|nr:hypothetical protein [Chloroflexota bacterium]
MCRSLRALAAGVAGALAYLAAQEIDRRLVNRGTNDLLLLGGLVTGNEAAWPPLGLLMHLSAGATFGLLFDRVAAPRLRGPMWLRGVLLAQIENTTLWPVVLLLDRSHVAVKRGHLAPMSTPTYFLQAVWRHAALGAVIGLLLPPPGTAGQQQAGTAG